MLGEVLIRLEDFEHPKSVEVMVGGNRFLIQLWWEFSPSMKVVSSIEKRRKFRLYREDDGGARAGERVCLGGTCDADDCMFSGCSKRRA